MAGSTGGGRTLQLKRFDTLGDAQNYKGAAGELVYGGPSSTAPMFHHPFIMSYNGESGETFPVGKVVFVVKDMLMFYLDASNGEDTLTDGRGLSVGKPWKTLGFAMRMLHEYFDTNACSKTIHFAPGTYHWENVCTDRVGHSVVIFDGTNNEGTGEVIITSGKLDNPWIDGSAIQFSNCNVVCRKIHFKSDLKPYTSGMVTALYYTTCTLVDCTFEHPLDFTGANIFIWNIGSRVVLQGTTTFKVAGNGFSSLQDEAYVTLMGAIESGATFNFLEGNFNIVFDGFDSAPDRTYLFTAQAGAHFLANHKLLYTGAYGSMKTGWVEPDGHIAVYNEDIGKGWINATPNTAMTDILKQKSTVISKARNASDEAPVVGYPNVQRWFTEIDKEYRRVGILSDENA